MVLIGRVRLPRGGHYFFLLHHGGVWVLAVLFVVLLVVAIRNTPAEDRAVS